MSVNLVTYANQTVTPTNDAIIYERAIDQNGIFYGCNVTVSSNEVHITGGYGMVCGREFTIDSEAIAVTLAPSGTLDGRLYVRLDLADADAPIQLLTATGNTLPPLEQDSDVNYTNGTYEMELATFTVGVSALSDCVETFETIIGLKAPLDNVIQQCTELNNVTTQALTSNIVGHSTETTLTTKNLDAGTYLIVANIYRSSVISAAINRVLFRLYAGTTIIGSHDYKPGGTTNATYINDTITTVVKLTATTTITLNGYCNHTADIGVDSADLYIVKLG